MYWSLTIRDRNRFLGATYTQKYNKQRQRYENFKEENYLKL